ncbi:hypothetical protein OJF2_09140 [Aquisphaera giovannonii]|uniref:Uncharacterized protein n=1 Tax=Aquisphaera giovannonii TaxID=406548 RepID=A0A5B9VVR8_9BACT|nr:hypothetical protein OJF2_09140 [Aquisphaera giovannonii]
MSPLIDGDEGPFLDSGLTLAESGDDEGAHAIR